MKLVFLKIRVLASYIPWLLHLLYYLVADPCQEAGGRDILEYEVAIKCYQSFPLIYDHKESIISTLVKASELDVQGRNLQEGIDSISSLTKMT